MTPKERIVTGMTGKPAETASKRTATQPKGAGLASRPVLTVAEATRAPGSKVEVCVTLRVGRQRFEGVSAGVGLEMIELRLAAEATLQAIHQAIGDDRFGSEGRMYRGLPIVPVAGALGSNFDAVVVGQCGRVHADQTSKEWRARCDAPIHNWFSTDSPIAVGAVRSTVVSNKERDDYARRYSCANL